MRPYLAVIRDSFREALATRVLWIVLILISLFLALVAPLGYEKTVAIAIHWEDLRDPTALVQHLIDHRDKPDTPAGYLWSKLPEDFQKELTNLKEEDGGRGSRMRAAGRLRNEINRQLHSREFYNEDVFKSVRLGAEAAEIRQSGLDSLDDERHARFTRLVFDVAFRDFIEGAGQDAVQFVYLWYPIGDEVPLTEDQLHQIAETVIAFVVSRLVGNLGVFIALLVTASIVPQMLDAGAIDLLLSKPVSRPFLFLSKFFGGCVFILLNTVFLIAGLWLVIGWRFGLWSSGLLWTIPVFVFVFAIYYSVSTLAAVIWRNAVVSIVVSILFWAVCFIVGVAKSALDEWFLNARRTAVIVPAEDSLIVTNRQGSGFEWRTDENTWVEVFGERRRGPGGGGYPMVGPYFDSPNSRLVAVRSGGGNRWMRSTPKLVVAPRDGDWKPVESIAVPSGVRMLAIGRDGEILVAGTGGLHRFDGDPEAGDGGLEVFGMKVPGFGQAAKFVRIDDDTLEWKSPFAASHDAAKGELAVRSGQKLALLTRNVKGQYEVKTSLEWPRTDQSLIGRAGSRVVLASEDGSIAILDAKTLQAVGEYSPFGRNQPRDIQSSPDGRWLAVLFHHRRLWLYDTQADQPGSREPAGQRDISAVAFGPDNSLFVSTGFGKVIQYDSPESMTEKARFAQQPDFLENLYLWGIDPVYTIFPKPGEMEDVVKWLLTKQETAATDDEADLTADRVVLDIWEPIWSNLAFLAVMLTVTCVYVTRKDF
ncbi:MAG: ABC transporter permease subunit [Planctomycetota bacterium]|nr:ABC transporter permease subunit [Planctomycetota bacterium]MDA1247918.1 ABC transporter permease subunit [Planctomycetota bacterium]